MPTKALRICGQPGCAALVAKGRCPKHRTTASLRGRVYPGLSYSSAAWRKLRAQVLREEPLCMCDQHKGADDAPASTVVDHITPHRGNPELFWSRANLSGKSKPCHDAKTSRDESWNVCRT